MIDRDALTRHTAGDRDLQRELLGMFLSQVRDLAALVRAEPPPAELPLLLHRLRGASAAVGAWGLAETLERSEAAMSRISPPGTPPDGLKKELDDACATLSGIIATWEPAALAKGGESR